MKQEFCDNNFLLNNDTAKKLYDIIKEYPILDYHNHLNVKELAENRKFDNIAQLWLEADHYKWRQMRTCGVSEKYITGDASDYDKYIKFVETCELMIGNPISQWSQLELKIYFDISLPLILKNAKEIWELTTKKLKSMSCRTFLEKSNVYGMCSTDDPIDNLEYHVKLKKDWPKVKVIGNFRPDKVMKIKLDGYIEYIKKLSDISKINIKNYSDLIKALKIRIDFFHEMGGRSADHGLDTFVFEQASDEEVNKIVEKKLSGKSITESEFAKYIGKLLLDLAKIYREKNWTMLLHISARRDNNSLLLNELGSDIGCDSVGEQFVSNSLNEMLDTLKKEDKLPRIVIFSLNELNWNAIATMAGNYQNNEENIKGWVQLGAAWWFADTYSGNKNQIIKFAELQSLGTNIGMLTDSRAYLSFARHDYYRRLLCDIVGEWSENGMCVNDMDILSKIVKNIAFDNAKEYFGY